MLRLRPRLKVLLVIERGRKFHGSNPYTYIFEDEQTEKKPTNYTPNPLSAMLSGNVGTNSSPAIPRIITSMRRPISCQCA